MLYNLYATPLITVYSVVVMALLGLVMGSFLDCLAWRSTHGESVLRGRSHCDVCGHDLAVRDLIPVVSWVSTGGRCRYCGEHISARCPATEVICAVAYVSILLAYDISPETLELVAFASILLVLSLTDLDEFIIPNGCIIAAIAVRVAYLLGVNYIEGLSTWQLFLNSLFGAIVIAVPVTVIALVMDKVLGRESLGFGDVKLLGVAGFYFGWRVSLLLLIVACVFGLVAAMFHQRRASGEASGTSDTPDGVDPTAFPWGPSIAAACWFVMIFGAPIVLWYASLF